MFTLKKTQDANVMKLCAVGQGVPKCNFEIKQTP